LRRGGKVLLGDKLAGALGKQKQEAAGNPEKAAAWAGPATLFVLPADKKTARTVFFSSGAKGTRPLIQS